MEKVMEKVTVKELIAKKMQRDEAPKTFGILVSSLNKIILMNRPTEEQKLNVLDEMGTQPKISRIVQVYKHLIYDCTPVLHDSELHEALEVKEPYDIMDMIFTVEDILDIGDKFMDITNMLGYSQELKNELSTMQN